VAFYCVGVMEVGRVRRTFTRFKRKVLKLMRTDCKQHPAFGSEVFGDFQTRRLQPEASPRDSGHLRP
jgi:hypothetical protein